MEKSLLKLRKFIENGNSLPMKPAEWRQGAACFSLRSITKGRYFVRAGDRPTEAGFVVSGLLQIGYLTSQGKPFVRVFCNEARPVVSPYSSLAAGRTCDVNIQAVEPSVLLVIPFAKYLDLVDRFPSWREFHGKTVLRTLLNREEHEYQLIAHTAAERYEYFTREFSDLAPRLNQCQIAAYLGVTPTSLNRIIRAQSKDRK